MKFIPSYTEAPPGAIVNCYDIKEYQDIFPLPNGRLNSSLHNKAKLCLLIPFSAITVKSLGISKKVCILNHNDQLKDPYGKKEIPVTKLHNTAHLGIHTQN